MKVAQANEISQTEDLLASDLNGSKVEDQINALSGVIGEKLF